MLNLELKNHSNYSEYTKNVVESNSLDVNNCLFTPELLTILLKSNKDKFTYFKQSGNLNRKVSKNKEGIYIIAFRILNKEKRSLVYNYIYYNDLLYLSLIVYFMLRNHYIINHNHEWGKYLVILDNRFLDYVYVSKYIDLYDSKDKTRNKLKI
jgi:hypothetical protein